VPVIGDLISSRSFSRDETELVVLVTAYLVAPYAEKAEINTPNPEAPQQEKPQPLAAAFAENIRRIYGRKAPDMLDESDRYGYLMN
jgi:pilus assembly protein CpaC